jgi:hypothetical protein
MCATNFEKRHSFVLKLLRNGRINLQEHDSTSLPSKMKLFYAKMKRMHRQARNLDRTRPNRNQIYARLNKNEYIYGIRSASECDTIVQRAWRRLPKTAVLIRTALGLSVGNNRVYIPSNLINYPSHRSVNKHNRSGIKDDKAFKKRLRCKTN